jgi:Gluconate 2-dehydrogenase subunit 3
MSSTYNPTISRRDSLKWLGALTSAVAVGGVLVACDTEQSELPAVSAQSHWPNLKFDTITGPKYGQDPKLISPTTPWSRTLSKAQLNLVATLCDTICPADEGGPSAREVGVPDVIDEWVSAPYSRQQHDRVLILNGLQWLDDEAMQRFKKSFLAVSEAQRTQIIDDIAFAEKQSDPEFQHAVHFFAKLRALILGGYFTSPEGIKDIGYMGNVPIMGDYPGPTEEAMAHLKQVIAELA